MSFANAARRLCGQSGLLLGWRPDEFWRATPDELGDGLGALNTVCGDSSMPIERAAIRKLMEMHPDG